MSLPNHVFVAQGDITRICADAIVMSVDTEWSRHVPGLMIPSFLAIGRGFPNAWPPVTDGLPHSLPGSPGVVGLGTTQWFPLSGPPEQRPFGVLVVATTHIWGTPLTEEEVEIVISNTIIHAVQHLIADERRKKEK